MTRPRTFVFATLALFALAGNASAQRASIAVGAATPVGDLADGAGTGLDAQLQIRTEPMIGPLSLRLDIGYTHLAAKGAGQATTISSQDISIIGDAGSMLYWTAGLGYYQKSQTVNVFGHTANESRQYLGAQASAGVNFPVLRWEGFLEVSGVKLFSPGPTIIYVPVRFGIRL